MIVSGQRVRKAWPYIVTVAPAGLPLTLAATKLHMKVDTTADDTLITAMIEAATEYAERYMGLWIINRTAATYRDDFRDSLEIRRAPMGSVSSVQYLVGGVLTAVSTDVYQVLQSNTFARLALKAGQTWPTGIDDQEQAVKITFTAGMAADDTTVPEDIREALLAHISCMYANRGDCPDASTVLPIQSAGIYNMRRVRSIWS